MTKRGRSTTFTQQVADYVCQELAKGRSLRRICADDENMPDESTVRAWAVRDESGFHPQYTRARDVGLDAMADELLDICDTPEIGRRTVHRDSGTEIIEADMIEHRRLKIDTRKWYLSKLAPKRYGQQHQDNEADRELIITVKGGIE